MDKDFLSKSMQVLGGVFALGATCFGYVSGFMLVGVQKVIENFKFIGITGTISSYTLIPLCIGVIVLGIIYNEKLFNINKKLCILTIIVGFMGTHFYFIVPSIIIGYVLYFNSKEQEIISSDEIDEVDNTIEYDNSPKETGLKTKIEMAKDLLEKNFNKTFISEITGLKLKEIDLIEELNKKETN